MAAVLALLGVAGCAAGGTEGADHVRPPAAAPVSQAGGPPGADNTGVPAGVDLRPSGDLEITEDGAVVEGLDVAGCVVVRAADVTIRNTRVRCADPDTDVAVRLADGATRLTVLDSEVDGAGVVDVGIGWSDYALQRVEITGTNDGARVGDDTSIESSWIHGMVRQGDLHPDAVQATQGTGITLRGNTLDPRDPGTGDLGNAAVMLGSETGSRVLEQVLVEGNWLQGGNYTVNVRQDADLADVVFRGNVYGPDSRYGPAQAPAGVEFAGECRSDGETWELHEVG
jgi:hypothetical protein